ncbi:MAG: hypothetical protein WD688_11950 [Candidatus Binatia bacterium]
MPVKKPSKKRPRKKKTRLCPECGSADVIPIVHGIPTPALQKLIDEGNAIIADREEWEGMSEWRCKTCGCDWSGKWRRFKIPGGVNATRTKK